MATTITYDNYDLQRDEIVTTNIVGDQYAPQRTLNIYKRANDDFSTFTSEYYDSRTITVEGFLHATTASGLRGLRDEFIQVMSRTEKNLDITRDATRRFTATVNSLDIDSARPQTTHAKFKIGFICSDAFSSATASISGMFTTNTSLTNTNITISGTYPARPTVRMNVLAGSVGSFQIENATISGSLEAIHTVPVGYDITMDLDNFQVTSSGNEIDYNGVFPLFRVQNEGVNDFATTISGNSYNVAVTIDYTPKYF